MSRTDADRHHASRSSELDEMQRTALRLATATAQLGYFTLVAIEIALALGFSLHLLGTDASSPIAEWVYRSFDQWMRPFRGIVEPIDLGTAGTESAPVFDVSALVAMFVYGVVALILRVIATGLRERLGDRDGEQEVDPR